MHKLAFGSSVPLNVPSVALAFETRMKHDLACADSACMPTQIEALFEQRNGNGLPL